MAVSPFAMFFSLGMFVYGILVFGQFAAK